MKNATKFICVTAALFCCAEAVRAEPVDQVLEWVGKRGAPELCKKGDAFHKVFSLRSFEGNLCKQTYIAAVAELSCVSGNIDKYDESSCHKYAIAELNGRDPAEVLKEAVKNGAGKAREFACGRPGIPEAAKAACPK